MSWIADHLESVVAVSARFIVMGDSAGGNLAAVVSQGARAHNLPISLQVLVYPVTNSNFGTSSYLNPENQLFISGATMRWFWDNYAADLDVRRSPGASPLQAPDLSGSPPALVLTAEYDVLRDEGELYALRLGKTDVRVTHRRFDRQMDSWGLLHG